MAAKDTFRHVKYRVPVSGYSVLFLFLVLLGLVVSPVCAKVITYDGKTNTSPIQDIINTTADGDSIFLTGGTYSGAIRIDRPIVFGALDTGNPPEIVATDSPAAITLAADGITLNGITISGNAEYGLLVQSNNNRISAITATGLNHGIGLKSARNNILSGNMLINNSIGIEVDRNSHSNIFYLNYFDNPRNVLIQANDNVWSSNQQDYQYSGRYFFRPRR